MTAMPRFCANLSLLFTEVPLLQRFALARQAGFTAVEIQFPYNETAEAVHAAAQAAGTVITLINVPAGDLMQGGLGLAGVPGQEAAFSAAVDTALHYAEVLGVCSVNVLAGRLAAGGCRTAALATLAANLTACVPRFAALGVRVGVEAINAFDMPHFLLTCWADMEAVVTTVNHPNLFAQLDLYHLARAGDDLVGILTAPTVPISHVQFADVPRRGEPYSGTLDWAQLFGLLDQYHPALWCGAEYRPSTGCAADSLAWLPRP